MASVSARTPAPSSTPAPVLSPAPVQASFLVAACAGERISLSTIQRMILILLTHCRNILVEMLI